MAKTIVMVLGVVLLLVGILGFFNDPVFNVFEVDLVHNLVHVVSGLVAIAMASMGESSAKTFAKLFGAVYGLVAVLGLVTSGEKLLGIMEVNGADDWLHVLLALVFLWVGFSKPSGSPVQSSGPTMGGQM